MLKQPPQAKEPISQRGNRIFVYLIFNQSKKIGDII